MANRLLSKSFVGYIQRIAFSLALLLCFFQTVSSQTIFALSGNNLISFNASTPGTLAGNVAISGIAAGQNLEGLDFRPNTGQLYALGYNPANGQARLYTLNTGTGVATAVGNAAVTLKPNMGKVSMDFNPTVDRIRVTGSNNANYRLHPVTGAIAATDTDLAFATTDVNAASNPSIGAVAYSNSYIGSTATTLYNFDDSLNIFTTQIPPNNGTLNTVGAAGITVNLADQSSDFDVYFDAASSSNKAYLAANTGAQSADNLYSVNLNTGATTLIGAIGTGTAVSNIAVWIERNVPTSLNGPLTYALTSNGNLISFDAGAPGTIRSLVSVSGIAAGQALSGLDFRPATGELYTLGYNSTLGEARLYTLDVNTGIATAIGTDPITLKANMGKISMDFNPTVDRIRVTASDNSNYRLHPVTGALAATDMALNFATGDINAGINPSVGAGAYTNSFGGAITTTLYNYDDSLNVLTTQVPPNNGTLNTVGNSGIVVNLADPSNDLDVFFSAYGNPNRAYLSANVGTSMFDNLYTIHLGTGLASLVGKIGNGIAVTDIAIKAQAAEVSCDSKTVECVKYELLTITLNAEGDKTYRIRITNNCTDKLVYAAFQLPNGLTAVGQANNSTYNSAADHVYDIRNPNFSPFYSIRFKDQSVEGISGGQSDLFEYSLPATANPNFIHVATRVGNTTREAYINVFGCSVNTSSRSEEDNQIEESNPIGASEFLVFPNPASEVLYADLSGWEGQAVQLQVLNIQGQVMLSQSIQAQPGPIAIALPGNWSEGLYFVAMNSADGTRMVQKVSITH